MLYAQKDAEISQYLVWFVKKNDSHADYHNKAQWNLNIMNINELQKAVRARLHNKQRIIS